MSQTSPVAPPATHTTTRSEPSEFIVLPDLLGDCHYRLRVNPHYDMVSRASEQWLFDEGRLVEPEITKFVGLRAGYLTAACYPDADPFHLQVCSDFMNWSWKMDDWLDEFDVDSVLGMRECCISAFRDPINFHTNRTAGKMCKSFFSRFRETGGPGCTERLIHTTDLYFIAAAKEVDHPAKGHIHDLESYITFRRDTSGCKCCFALIEYAAQIDLPDEVVSHPVMMATEGAANDHVSWVNDICSYNVEQSRNVSHNLIALLMRERGLDLQDAVDYSGQMCKSAMQRFEDNRAILPSWGEEVDRQVAIYVQGLQDWIIANYHWSFESTRYFGKDGEAVKRDRIIKLLPKRPL
ncbi:isoprenoid synthase domain-containing protein [Suillus clintonianus]|uniref:isoprenoid synthase domain-containing protein n=1 Tax=Suillus clintonianus TaxID=1904413 RepID=UPI001B869FB9|nr:isoprenoid synthase domain-containing protein [Suillus clintonianus]KAG2128257.1 isoprenoid synthase domain-containing protein [Suillus clintonianus]